VQILLEDNVDVHHAERDDAMALFRLVSGEKNDAIIA